MWAINFLTWISRSVWHMIRWWSKKKHHNNTCLKDTRLYNQIFFYQVFPRLIMNTIGRTYVFMHFHWLEKGKSDFQFDCCSCLIVDLQMRHKVPSCIPYSHQGQLQLLDMKGRLSLLIRKVHLFPEFTTTSENSASYSH